MFPKVLWNLNNTCESMRLEQASPLNEAGFSFQAFVISCSAAFAKNAERDRC